MKIKIDKRGRLFIKRAGKLEHQFCPYNHGSCCGDHCPLFNDSLPDTLELCSTIYTTEIIDERERS